MSFLPKNYQAPKTSGFYMKLQDGENKIRILSQPVIGWEDWIEKKPVRFKMDEKPKQPFDAKSPVRHFWAFIVWNYAEEQIQVLHVTQATIRSSIEALCKDEDWGDPFFYDIKIIRKGEELKTEYMVNPLPHKSLSENIKAAFEARPCNLEAMFDNADPFSLEWETFTKGVFSKEDIKVNVAKKPTITKEQAEEITEALFMCDEAYVAKLWKTLHGLDPSVTNVSDIPAEIYPRILAAAHKNAKQMDDKEEKIA